ncbi:MAG: hypothetical protein HC800_18865 [Phormidesmis sp. RL_2_1]|nr:hypothetical protein [Phormidesmis sp. RL_2_1]
MAIYRRYTPFYQSVFRPSHSTNLGAIALAASTALLVSSCSQLHTAGAQDVSSTSSNSTAAGNDLANASTTAESTASQVPKGVNTNHDIYHSRALEVPAGTPVPAITVEIEPDAVEGWNLYAGTANFTFTPSKVNGESSPTEGFAYLYINDKPIQRIYSTWTHLPDLPGGTNTIRVTLNANGHETLTTQNSPIEDTTTIEVYKPSPQTSPSQTP